MEIREDDLTGPEIRALLARHLEHMHEVTPAESVDAMDVDRLSAPDVTFWSAWDDGALVGCAALKELDPSSAEVKSMRTAEHARGRGVGAALMEHLLAVARARGYERVLLETGSAAAFDPARRLYERSGFVERGPFPPYTDDPNKQFMELVLDRSTIRTAMKWGERLVLLVLFLFAFNRLGPQFGALLGVGPDLGSAPAYAFTAFDGTRVSSDELLGSVVVLNFWATWCGPCKLEMPALQSLHEDMAADGVAVVGLATDADRGPHVEAFLDVRGIDYPIGYASAAHRRAFGGVSMIPTTYIIDRSGVIQHKVLGYFAPPAMRAAVRRLLEEPPPVDGIADLPADPSAAQTAPSGGRAAGR